MASEKLFGNHVKPSCSYCEEGFVSATSDQILCVKNGVVTPDYSCKSFHYDPLKRAPAPPPPLGEEPHDTFQGGEGAQTAADPEQ